MLPFRRDPRTPPVIEVIEPEMAALLRSKTGAERLRIASDMFTYARRLLQSHLRATHPEWDERVLNEAVATRLSQRRGPIPKLQD